MNEVEAMRAQKTQEMEAKISSPQSLSSFEMGRNDVNIVCTYGKIAVWFGRKVPDYIIAQILIGISKIDQSAIHEFETICNFDDITEYESKGYILVSYGKTAGGYRVNYSIPFSIKRLSSICLNLYLKNSKGEMYVRIFTGMVVTVIFKGSTKN